MRVSLVVLILFATTFSGTLCALTPEQLTQIDQLINDVFIPTNYVTGMSLSVVLDGETEVSKGYGKLDIEKGIDAGKDTLFSIGSLTKSFIGVLAVKTLSEKFPSYGEAALDVPIVSLVQGFNFTFSDRFRAEQTSFRDLLSHRTCLNNLDNLALVFGQISTSQEYIYRLRYQTEVCGHRTGHVYNNGMFALAGELIAHLAEKPVQQLVRDFLHEIGMQNATTIDESASYENKPNMAQGYYRRNGQIEKYNMKLLRNIHVGLGAGGIIASSDDIAKYLSFHLNKGKVGDRQVVSEEALSWMYKPSMFLGALPGDTGRYAYGLGLGLGLYGGWAYVDHGGYWPPYKSHLALFPAKNLGIFLVTNGPGDLLPGFDHSYVAAQIFQIVTGLSNPNLPKSLPTNSHDIENFIGVSKILNFPKKVNTDMIEEKRSPKIEFADVVGWYGHEIAGDMYIYLDGVDTRFLQVNLGEWGIGRLIPESGSDTLFGIEWKTDIMQFFYTYPTPVPVFRIDFGVENKAIFLMDGQEYVFVKGAGLETFPPIPWDPTSCGPK